MKKKISAALLFVSILILLSYFGITASAGHENEFNESIFNVIYNLCLRGSGNFISPRISFLREGKISDVGDIIENAALCMYPIVSYEKKSNLSGQAIEDQETYEMILRQQAESENEKKEEIVQDVEEKKVSVDTSAEKLNDFEYVVSNFYTVDSGTVVYPEDINAERMMSEDMRLNNDTGGPKILIFHSHAQESFADSTPGDTGTSIMAVGAYLAEALNKKGIETIHHKGVYDLVNGELDRGHAYELAEVDVKEIIRENPSIEVVIDLHRDGVNDSTHLIYGDGEKQAAQIMFFNGMSRSRLNGEITYLPNPYIKDNLAFSFQMQLASEKKYPGFARRIYLREYRYILHLKPKSLLIEAGAQTNTLEEMFNAMDILADILNDVLNT